MNTVFKKESPFQFTEVQEIIKGINEHGIFTRKMTIDQRSNGLKKISLAGQAKISLSNDYLKRIALQITHLESQILTPLAKAGITNYVLEIESDAQGNFKYHLMSLLIQMDCKPTKNPSGSIYSTLKKLLPFAEFMTEIRFKGNNHRLSYLTGSMRITFDDLVMVLEEPIFSPKLLNEWDAIIQLMQINAEAYYEFEESLPCIDGKLVETDKKSVVHFSIRA